MRRWIRANMLSLDVKVSSVALHKPSKAAHDILKVLLVVYSLHGGLFFCN